MKKYGLYLQAFFIISLLSNASIYCEAAAEKAEEASVPTKSEVEPFLKNITHEGAIKPFANFAFLPSFVKEISLTNTEVGIASTKAMQEVYVKGIANIPSMNIKANGELHFVKTKSQGLGAVLRVDLGDDWKLSNSIPNTKFLDQMPFKAPYIIASSVDYKDPQTKIETKAGLNFFAQAVLTGPLEPVGRVLGSVGQMVTVYGLLDPLKPRELVLGAQLTAGKPIETSVVTIGPFSFEITGEPSIDLLAKATVRPSGKNGKDQPLDFYTKAKVNTTRLEFAGSMSGLWNNPFGIPGFSIGNLGALIGIDYAVLVATSGVPAPTIFGLSGQMKLGTFELFLAGKANATFTQTALQGQLSRLYLYDIVTLFAKPMGANVPVTSVPNIGVQDIDVRFAATNVKIGEITIDQGLTLKGLVDLLKKRVVVDFNIDRTGLTATGCMSKLDLGALHISKSKAEPDSAKKYRAAKCAGLEDGPILDIQLNTQKQQILISGRLVLDYIFETDNFLVVSKDGIKFHFKTDLLGGMGQSEIKGGSVSNDLNETDFTLQMEFEQKFTKFVQEEVNSALTTAEKAIRKALGGSAQSGLSTAKSATDKAFDSAVKALESARDKVNDLQKSIDKRNDEIKKLKKDSMIRNALSIGKLETEIAGLKVAKTAADAALATAQLAVDKIARTATSAALDVAKGSVKGAEVVSALTVKGTNKTIQTLAGTIAVEGASFNGRLSELKNGVMPHVEFNVIILGKRSTIKLDFDFKHPVDSTKKIANDLANSVKDQIA